MNDTTNPDEDGIDPADPSENEDTNDAPEAESADNVSVNPDPEPGSADVEENESGEIPRGESS